MCCVIKRHRRKRSAYCDRCYRSVVCSSVILVHPTKAVGRNKMPFCWDTCVVPSNTVLDRGSGFPGEGEIWGWKPPVRSHAAYRQITLTMGMSEVTTDQKRTKIATVGARTDRPTDRQNIARVTDYKTTCVLLPQKDGSGFIICPVLCYSNESDNNNDYRRTRTVAVSS